MGLLSVGALFLGGFFFAHAAVKDSDFLAEVEGWGGLTLMAVGTVVGLTIILSPLFYH